MMSSIKNLEDVSDEKYLLQLEYINFIVMSSSYSKPWTFQEIWNREYPKERDLWLKCMMR